LRQYETGFVLSPTLSEEETTQFLQKMAEIVAQKKGHMVKQDIWGKRRLAFPVKRYQEGFYVFFTYDGPGDVSLELERRFKQSDAVIRFMTVLKDPRDLVRRKKKRRAEDAAMAAQAAPAPAATGSSGTTGSSATTGLPASATTGLPAAEVKEEK